MSVAIGVDVGTTNTKVVAATSEAVVALRSAPSTRSAEKLFTLVSGMITELVDEVARPIAALGLASVAESGWALDAHDRPLGLLVSWQDARSSGAFETLVDEVGAAALFAATGVRPAPKTPVAMWLALREHEPARFAAMRRWAGVADWLHLCLTGALRTDHSLAGRTMAYALPADGAPLARTFSTDLIAEAGLDVSQLPSVGLPGDRLDGVCAEAACATGLAVGTPVLVAGHDHQVGGWAGGVRSIADTFDSIGTAEALLTIVGVAPAREAVRREGMSVVRTVDGDHEAILGGSPSSGAFLQWAADHWSGGSVTDLLSELPSTDDLRPSLELLLPYPNGRQAPRPDPTATVERSRVDRWARGPSDQPQSAPVGVLTLEALCYQAQWLLDTQHHLAGLDGTGRLAVLGDAVRRTPLWGSLKATLARRPTQLVGSPQPVAHGAALLALVRTGEAPPEASLPSEQIPPITRLASAYDERLRAFIGAAQSPLRG